MGGLTLLDEAKAAGLTIRAEGDRLVIRGPKSAGRVALRLIEAKAEVMAALKSREFPTRTGATWVDVGGEPVPCPPWVPPLNWQEELDGWTDEAREAWDERAAIMQFDGGLDRIEAEAAAFVRVGAMIRDGRL